MRKAVFSGSFDPITKGHEDIVLKALPLFDEVIVAIGINNVKKCAFPLERRLQWIKDTGVIRTGTQCIQTRHTGFHIPEFQPD